ncbi:hypothetical protein [Coralloluteibacterium thermophilus]|uniref:PD-(D/E)XK nuclease superfamily protein n=1 Tax=Coralloluteibacterium thermophilum TaxID=2707049 RepID=A0ABV9NEV0_9GAMM
MPIGRKFERDIDLLLAEEFMVNEQFAAWFLSRSRLSHEVGARVVDVDVSKATSEGESDLIVYYERGSGERVALFIEDKINAPLQPEQAKRYVSRAEALLAGGDLEAVDYVLCAPAAYIKSCPAGAIDEFTTRLSYEDLAEHFAAAGTSLRAQYRARFLREAACKHKTHWERQIDDATNAFWDAAYALASREYPILEMGKKTYTKNQTWITFRPRDFPTMPQKVEIHYKGDRGFVDLAFGSTSAHRMHTALRSKLPADMTLHQTGRSTSLRIEVPAYSIAAGWDAGRGAVTAGFAAAARLISFFREHRDELMAAAVASRSTS